MNTAYRHVLAQGPVLAALGRTAFMAIKQQLDRGEAQTPTLPGPLFTDIVEPRSLQLVEDYLDWAGAEALAWNGQVPPHLFGQWGFPLLSKTLKDLPYPLAKVLNAGCRIEAHRPLPDDAPLHLSGRLTKIDDDGRRVVLTQSLVTADEAGVPYITTEMRAIVPLGGGEKGEKSEQGEKKKTRATVPTDAIEVKRWQLDGRAGLAFACLTGDFNPIHWIAPYGKLAGFGGTILHGFGTLALSIEAMNRVLWDGDVNRLKVVDVRFTRPLRLPADVGCYVRTHDDGLTGEFFVGDAPDAPAYLTGTFELNPAQSADA